MASENQSLSLLRSAGAWQFVLSLGFLIIVLRTLYRLYLHPLAHIPGPRIAAVSRAYEFYHDVLRGGMYLWEVEKMHEKYGPVVRISPGELHIKDAYFYDEIYSSGSRRQEKSPEFAAQFPCPTSMVATIDHDLHRQRRGLLNNFFSKQSIEALAPMMRTKEMKLMKRFEESCRRGAIVRLDDAYSALSADIISHYAWGSSLDYLDTDNFNNGVRDCLNELIAGVHVSRIFPKLQPIMKTMPRWLWTLVRPRTKAFLDLQAVVAQSISKTPDRAGKHETIFDALLDETIPPIERSDDRLEDEGLLVLIAGMETTARTLSIASYHLYRNRSMLEKLRNELKSVMATPTTAASWSKLEQLPYLNAVINEALRLSHGAIWRSPRCAPTESLTYGDLVIPPGTPVGMSVYFIHTDPEIFPEPHKFQPERWIEAAERGEHLTKHLVSFSRGHRMCIGLNLAYAELYRTLAMLIRRFDMELHETGPKNIAVGREYGVGEPKDGKFSVHVKITKVLTE